GDSISPNRPIRNSPRFLRPPPWTASSGSITRSSAPVARTSSNRPVGAQNGYLSAGSMATSLIEWLRIYCALAALAIPVSAAQTPKPPARPSSPNVVLITVDTLRADHLGCYGDAQIATPNIDKLATEGVRFKTVVTAAPLTLPSHCSIMTGAYPTFHGVR